MYELSLSTRSKVEMRHLRSVETFRLGHEGAGPVEVFAPRLKSIGTLGVRSGSIFDLHEVTIRRIVISGTPIRLIGLRGLIESSSGASATFRNNRSLRSAAIERFTRNISWDFEITQCGNRDDEPC